MKLQALPALFGVIFFASCGDDVSRNGIGSTREGPQITSDISPLPLTSGILRDLGAVPLSYSQEIKTSDSLPAAYRSIPNLDIDDEGLEGLTMRTRTQLGRPNIECGLTRVQTLKARVKECLEKNGNNATWNGTLYASGTEGRWDLVALKISTAKSFEIWVDRKTGMLWSDVFSETNWCQASGNEQAISGMRLIDCQVLNKKNICVGESILDLLYINWRLPTRSDYLQADLDGLRFVLKPGNTNGFWTATLSSKSSDRSFAWVYNSDVSGTLVSEKIDATRQVRCIGSSTN